MPVPTGPSSAPARLVISAVSLAAAAAWLLGRIAELRVPGAAGYLLFGAGAAPWALLRRPGLTLRLALSVGTSLSGLILISAMMLQLGAWHPGWAAAIVLTATVPAHVVGLAVAVRERPPLRLPRPHPALPLGVAGAVICAPAALTHRHLDPGTWGFPAEIGPLWYAGLGLVVLALVLARSAGEAVTAIGVVLLVLVLTGTPALVYDGPRSQSAAKHLQLVAQISTLHHLDSTVPVYNGWPGYFTAMAWLSDAAGLRHPVNLAIAWPVLIGLARLVALRYLAGRLIADRYRVWLAVAFAFLADTVGQDYFSPQSAGFVLGLIVFGFALSRLPLAPKLAAMAVAGTAMSLAHQLTPYAVGGALCVLAAFRLIRPWWLPSAVLAPAAGWALLHWPDLRGFLSLDAIGRVANLRPPATPVTPGLSRMAVVPVTSGALLIGVLILVVAAGTVVVRRRRERAIWAVALCPAAGVFIILVNPYGNEGIFRATLFGIPWLAVLAAQAFRPAVPVLCALVALTTTYVIASFGLDATNVVRPADREAFRRFETTHPGSPRISYLLLLGPGDLPSSPPTQSHSHAAVKRSDLDPAGFALTGAPATAIEAGLTRSFAAYAPPDHLYAIWSPVSARYGQEYGIHTAAQFTALRDAFLTSPSWVVFYSADGTLLFQYTGVPG